MNAKERIDAVLAGRAVDRPPFSFWYHFTADQVAGDAAVRAHVDQLDKYDMDFLKVMNDNAYPHPGRIERVEDLKSLGELKGTEEGFGRQLELLSALKKSVGDRVYTPTTIFNAWMVLRLLVQPPKLHSPPNLDAAADGPSAWIRRAWKEKPELVERAFGTIGQNLARFGRNCLKAGADGIFLSVRDDWVDTADTPRLYERLVRPTDVAILGAVASARFNILHVCGRAVNFRAFAEYPAIVVHWADRAAGPAIGEVAPWIRAVPAGGIDNLSTLVSGTSALVRAEILDAVRQASKRPIIIAPGCTFDPQRVPEENLRTIGAVVRGLAG